jgi:hypothetical protein
MKKYIILLLFLTSMVAFSQKQVAPIKFRTVAEMKNSDLQHDEDDTVVLVSTDGETITQYSYELTGVANEVDSFALTNMAGRWVRVGGSDGCQGTTESFVATANQTDIILVNEASIVQVFKGSIFQEPTYTYTYNQTTKTITFLTPLEAGDRIFVGLNCIIGSTSSSGTDLDNQTLTFDATASSLSILNENTEDLSSLQSPWENLKGTFANQSSTDIYLPTGKVGIGANNPLGNLSIRDANGDQISFYTGKVAIGNFVMSPQLNTNTIQSSGSNINELAFAIGRVEVLRMTKTYNVGIGTTAPTEKLQVVGNITANAYLITSDERVKYNFKETGITKTINGKTINVYSYQRLLNGKSEIGVKAQDVLKALDGLAEETIDLIIPKTKGFDLQKTVYNIKENFETKAENLEDIKADLLDELVKIDLENNGFPVINREDALKEVEGYKVRTDLSEKKQDRYDRFQLVDFTGDKILKEFYVEIEDLLNINTTALSWILK